MFQHQKELLSFIFGPWLYLQTINLDQECLYIYLENYSLHSYSGKKFPLHAIHLLLDHRLHPTNYVIKSRIPVVPDISGPRIPDRCKKDNADLYAKYALLLFKPFRSLDFESMKRRNYNFRIEFTKMINSQNFKKREYEKILDNSQEYYEGEKVDLVTTKFNKLK